MSRLAVSRKKALPSAAVPGEIGTGALFERFPMKTKADLFKEKEFLKKIPAGKTLKKFTRRKAIFRQGDPADAVFYIEQGRVKLRVVSSSGKKRSSRFSGREIFWAKSVSQPKKLEWRRQLLYRNAR